MSVETIMVELDTAIEYLASDIYYGEIGTDSGQPPPEALERIEKILRNRFKKVINQIKLRENHD